MSPAAPRGSGEDPLAILSLGLGVFGLGFTGFVTLIGIGMIVAPNEPADPKSGALCMVVSAIACGLPGLLGLGAGFYRLRRKSR